MEYRLKSALVILALSSQFGLISPAPIRISRHVPNSSAHSEDLPSVEPAKTLQSSHLDYLPPPKEPVKILRSTDHDVIIQISRLPGSYLKNETIRLQITNGEVISSNEGTATGSNEEVAVSSEEGRVKVRSAVLDHSSGQSVEVLLVTLGPAAEDLTPTAVVADTKKNKKSKKKVSVKDVGPKLNATVEGKVNSVKGHVGKGGEFVG